MLDPESHEKMHDFLAAAAREGVAAPWEMTAAAAGKLRLMQFAAVLDAQGIVIAAAPHLAGLAKLIDTAEASLRMDEAVLRLRQARQLVERHSAGEAVLFDELTRQHNEMAGFQRELARENVRLESHSEWLESILSGLQEAVIVVDPVGRVTFANPAVAKMIGRERTACIGRPVKDVIALVRAGQAVDMAVWLGEVLRSGRTSVITDCVLAAASGHRPAVAGSATPVRDNDGHSSGVVIVLRDTTEALRVQALVVDAKRLEVSRELAAGVAHTVNNLLAVILGNAEILARDLPGGNREVTAIKESVKRAVGLTSRLLSSTGQVAPATRLLDLNDLLRETLALAGPFPEEVEVTMVLEGRPIPVQGDASLLSVAFRDILVNARESILRTGHITITTNLVPRGEETDTRGPQVEVSIHDDGCGMTAEVQSRLFEPFFTTKLLGRGLGLPSARGIIAGHGGCIHIESREGKGTTVAVTLPLSEQGPAAPT